MDCRIVNAEVAEVFVDWPHMLVTTSIGAIRKLVSELHGDTLHTMMVFRDKVCRPYSLYLLPHCLVDLLPANLRSDAAAAPRPHDLHGGRLL